MSNYDTFKDAGYSYVRYVGNGTHILRNADGKLERWASNRGHASWGLIYKNTHLEFCSSNVEEQS